MIGNDSMDEETFKRIQQELEKIELQKEKNKKLVEQSNQSFVNSKKINIAMSLFYKSIRWRLVLLSYVLMLAYGAILGLAKIDTTVIEGMVIGTCINTLFLVITLIKIFIDCFKSVKNNIP